MPGVGAQVVQFGAVLGRDDEAEMVPVVGAAFLESVEVGVVGLRPVGPARLAIAAGAVALDVAQEIGSASGRERVCSVRVNLGGRRHIKKKKNVTNTSVSKSTK